MKTPQGSPLGRASTRHEYRLGIGLALLIAVATITIGSPASAATLKVLRSFSFSQPYYGTYADGAVVFGPNGVLYSTTNEGGNTSCDGGNGCGTVFALAPNAQNVPTKYTRIHALTGKDAAWPRSGLVLDGDGNLFGATWDGGGAACFDSDGCGVVFVDMPPARRGAPWTHKVLHAFNGNDGAFPNAALARDPVSGVLYGTTCGGGKYQAGTVFSLTPNGPGKWNFAVIYDFPGGLHGDCPEAPLLVLHTAGVLYGTTYYGGRHQFGTVFKLSKGSKAWTGSVIYSFRGQANGDGQYPQIGLVGTTNGDLYGATNEGGTNNYGAIYRLHFNGSKWVETVVASFDYNTTGGSPHFDRLAVDGAGNLYGTAQGGGAHNRGTVFKAVNNGGGSFTLTSIYDFCSLPNCADGAYPYAGVVRQGGKLYGTTDQGGAFANANNDGAGTVWQLTLP